MLQNQFTEIANLIKQSRSNAIRSINTALIDLYWNIGAYISKRIENAEWGQSVVKQLSIYLQETEPGMQGFSDKNLWRMKQFFETYQHDQKVSALLRELTWTNNLIILSRCKTEDYSRRELERQISASLFERTMIGNTKVSPLVRELQGNTNNSFKDSYVFDFLNLPESYTEGDLQKGLVNQMKNFILELGKDYLFMGNEYKIQVGNSDFYIDLLFYHRDLQCLIAIELKADKFKPENIGQLNFYLEALDRDVKKPHENPSIGVLLCKDKDSEVVEYSMSRSLSPTMVAAYKTQLPDKKLLQQKLHELFEYHTIERTYLTFFAATVAILVFKLSR